MSRLQGLPAIGVGLFSAWTMLGPAWAGDLGRSWPKDTTPYSRPAVPEDHAPGGRQPLGPATTSAVNVQRIVDAVVNNTDPTLKNSDAFNDGEISIAINPLNPDEIVMSAYSGMWTTYTPAAPLWHSTDGGQTWTKRFVIDRPNVDGTAFCPCNQTVDFGRQNRLFYGVTVTCKRR